MRVAVAIITDEQDRILITQRPYHVAHGGCWEFPGGKLEPDEIAEHALIREIKEELGLEIQQYHFLGEIHHQYSDKQVHLIIFQITQFKGNPSCLEGQLNLRWSKTEELNYQEFPEANRGIFNLIQKIREC